MLACLVLAGAPPVAPAAAAVVAPGEVPVTAPAERSAVQAQQRRDEGRRNRRDARPRPDPAPLWSLYPLDPLAGETPAPPAVEDADPLEQAAPPQPGGAVAAPPEPEPERATLPLAAVGAAVLLLLLGAAWLFVRRWAPAPAAAGAAPPSGAPSPPAGNDDPVTASAQHVRVHLSDGRSIEGWRRGEGVGERRVLVLDVEEVYDATGKKVERTPRDSFLSLPQIERVELLDERPGSDAPG